MRGGLERLGANTDNLVQMKALSQTLAQHRTLNVLSAVSNQLPSQQLPAPLPSGPASKGPHLPLRPKLHQPKQGSAMRSHTHPTPTLATPQGAAAVQDQTPSPHSSAASGQENDLHSWHLHTTTHPLQGALPASGRTSDTLAAHQAGEADHSHTWNNRHLPLSAGAGNTVSRDFNPLASPGQLVAGLQQSVLGQSEAASDVAADQQEPLLPVSYPDRPPNHLDPKQYYEDVAPSKWMPEAPETWLELHRRAYCGHADAAFPFLFVALVALACTSQLLSPGLLLAALPVVFVVGLQVMVISGAGIPAQELPASRLVCSLVACLQVTTFGAFLNGMTPLIPDRMPETCVLVACLLALPLLHYRAATTDPGYVRKGQVSVDAADALKEEELLSSPKYSQGTCYTCHVQRPLRSKHCITCDRCVGRFDHHCPAISNCVGQGNQRSYSAWLALLLLAQLLFLHLATLFCARTARHHWNATGQHDRSGLLDVLPALWLLFKLHPGKLMLTVIEVPLLAVTVFLAGRQAFCIAGNLTINELLNSHRYHYLRRDDGSFYNRFDRGPLANCLQFCSGKAVPWDEVFHEERLAVASDSVSLVPTISTNGLIRWKDDFRQRMDDVRIYRRLKREEELLQKYGAGLHTHNHCGSCQHHQEPSANDIT
ncbi:hypothetical protein ABBQ38_002117 [Trebouxia sp. C0009 RCD-2024]